MQTRRAFLGAFLTGFFGLGSYAFGFEPLVRLDVTRYTVKLPRWPAQVRPMTIALVADIHAVDPWMSLERITDIVATTNGLKPDLTLLLGDYVGTVHPRRRLLEPDEWAAPLQHLSAPLGVYAILGNHDYLWRDGVDPVQAALERVGIDVFINSAKRLSFDGHPFWLTGTTSILSGPRYGYPRGPGIWRGQDDLKGTLAQVTDDAPVIHMAHEPDLFPRIPSRVGLTVSGHTHGGQVNLPFIGRPISNSSYGEKYVYGHVVEGDRQIVISGGLGCSTLPVRLGVPPEIVLLTVTA